MKQSESISKLLSGLMDVQREIPTMPKNAKAYGYKYTDLDTITSVIKPILARHDISYMQSVGMNEQGQNILTTRIFNRDGEYIEDSTILPIIQGTKNNSAQTLGMAITYMRRYALCAMFGITSDEDVDANTFNAPQPQPQQAPQNVQNVTNAMNGTVTETRNIGVEIKNLLESVDANGMAIFTENDKERFRAECKSKGLSAVLSDVQNELTRRRNAK
jgi:hypothetical protein